MKFMHNNDVSDINAVNIHRKHILSKGVILWCKYVRGFTDGG
jgi:hypothetical protein